VAPCSLIPRVGSVTVVARINALRKRCGYFSGASHDARTRTADPCRARSARWFEVMTSLPHSVEAEQAVLGSLLIDATAFGIIGPLLSEDDFSRPDHRLIFGAVSSLARDEKPHDIQMVCEELRHQGHEDAAGGFSYLGQLARETATSVNVKHYANIVRDRSIARQTIGLANNLATSSVTAATDIADLLGDAERQFARLKSRCSKSASPRSRLTSIEARDFLSMEIAPRQFLLSPILPAQGLTMVYGPRGLGKTQVSVGIAVAIAAGAKFLKWSAPQPASVLLIDGEMPASAMQARLADAIKASDLEPKASLRLVTPDLNWEAGMPDLSTSAGQEAVDALVSDDTRLIIVDNLSSLLRTGVENDSESWLPLQTWALRHRAAGRSVLFIHHAGKGGAQRGTSRREDVLDCVVALRRPSDYRQSEGARFEVHIEKGRSLFGQDAMPFEAQLASDSHGNPAWTLRDLEVNQMKQITEMSGLGMKPVEIAQELGISKATVYRRMKENGSTSEPAAVNGHA